MNAESLYVIKITLWVIAGISGISAGWFEFRDRWQVENDRKETQEYYGRLWRSIQDSGLNTMPERVIRVLLEYRELAMTLFLDHALKITKIITRPFWYPVLKLLIITTSFTIAYQTLGIVYAFIIVIPWLSYGIATLLAKYFNVRMYLATEILWVTLILSLLVTSILALSLLLTLSTLNSTIILTIIAPVFRFFVGVALVFVASLIRQMLDIDVVVTFGNFGVSMGFSFSITMASILIGTYASPNSWVPQTVQMFLSNVFCDGLTVYATIHLLQLVVKEKSRWPLPFILVIDLIIAGVLACASLYFGLFGTEKEISILGCLHTLIGLSPSGEVFELGPYFWAMHTTFLPTLLYLSIILFCWFGKMLIIPIAKLISRGSVVEKPHHLTAGAFALIAVIFGVLATGAGHFEDAAKEREAEVTKVTIAEVRNYE